MGMLWSVEHYYFVDHICISACENEDSFEASSVGKHSYWSLCLSAATWKAIIVTIEKNMFLEMIFPCTTSSSAIVWFVKCQVIVTWYFLVEFRVISWCTIMDTAWGELAKRPSALSMEKLQVRTIDPHVLCILTWTPLPRKRNGHVANQVVWLLVHWVQLEQWCVIVLRYEPCDAMHSHCWTGFENVSCCIRPIPWRSHMQYCKYFSPFAFTSFLHLRC